MKYTKELLLAALAAVLLAPCASAELKGKNELAVQAGFLNFEGDTQLNAGLALGARLGHFFTEEISGEALLFRSGGKDATAFYPGVAGSYHFRYGKWMPFAQVGMGVMRVNAAGIKADSAFSVHWGGGLKYFYKPDFLLRADLDHVISTEKGPGTHDLMGVLGVSWLFGSVEEAKKIVEQVKQAVAADSDKDGVTDDKDNCPGTPAGVKVDAAGCPVPVDSDGDGVTDDKDNCANTPAGVKVDAAGCPVPVDSDADGVENGKDQCEGTPAGTKVGPTGCPEAAGEIPADNWVLKGVNFEVGSDVLTADSLKVLDDAAAVLQPRKSVRIEIQGHTDSTGDAQKNMELSDKRALAVKNYLTGKGIDAARLETKGYGSSMPVGDNATAEGRAANRRIEFKVLSR
jgi:OOP family OmpA-OmpF porin